MKYLLFRSTSLYFSYNNLICVTPQGIEADDTNEELKSLMFPVTDRVNKKFESMIRIQAHVNFVYGFMTEINR